jgi:hypothetical protein
VSPHFQRGGLPWPVGQEKQRPQDSYPDQETPTHSVFTPDKDSQALFWRQSICRLCGVAVFSAQKNRLENPRRYFTRKAGKKANGFHDPSVGSGTGQ